MEAAPSLREASKTRSTGSRWRSLPFRVTAPPAQRAAFKPNEHPSECQWARAGGQDQGGYKVSTALLTSPAVRDRLSLLSPCTKDFPWKGFPSKGTSFRRSFLQQRLPPPGIFRSEDYTRRLTPPISGSKYMNRRSAGPSPSEIPLEVLLEVLPQVLPKAFPEGHR